MSDLNLAANASNISHDVPAYVFPVMAEFWQMQGFDGDPLVMRRETYAKIFDYLPSPHRSLALYSSLARQYCFTQAPVQDWPESDRRWYVALSEPAVVAGIKAWVALHGGQPAISGEVLCPED